MTSKQKKKPVIDMKINDYKLSFLSTSLWALIITDPIYSGFNWVVVIIISLILVAGSLVCLSELMDPNGSNPPPKPKEDIKVIFDYLRNYFIIGVLYASSGFIKVEFFGITLSSLIVIGSILLFGLNIYSTSISASHFLKRIESQDASWINFLNIFYIPHIAIYIAIPLMAAAIYIQYINVASTLA
ncbi:hypothetical protein ACI6TM_004453, partial [Vibrio alginolyticus]